MRILNVGIGVIFLALSLSVAAQESKTVPDSPVPAIQTAIVQLNQLLLTEHSTDRVDLIKTQIIPLFDFEHIANQVLSVIDLPLNREAAASFSKQFKHQVMTTLLLKLSYNEPRSFQFVSAKQLRNGVVAVQLRVSGYGRFGTYLGLLLHQNVQGRWQIFDIVLNRDSLVDYYQKQLLTKIRRYGIYKVLGEFSSVAF